ncbi:hypothetical protein Msi02_33940 [Microbispora siamensis]|uniref:Uncharacterized protein n=1 Tax=Microbispora siamensis TaxID=564413 RepID=A0ABQ4GMD7_9ACTN|nr:hypothetical protein Msi02_33940 [Microbispora siamensis]
MVSIEATNHAPNAAAIASIVQTSAAPTPGRYVARWAARSEPVVGASAANGPRTGCRRSSAMSPRRVTLAPYRARVPAHSAAAVTQRASPTAGEAPSAGPAAVQVPASPEPLRELDDLLV